MELLSKNVLHRLFKISIFLKGLDSLLQIIGGIFLILVKPESINNIIQLIFHYELIEDPQDLIVNFFINLFSNLPAGTQLFGAIYLLSHGIIKLALIIGLWKKKLWTYIAAEIVFTLFIIYQVYRFAFTHSVFLILLTLLDAVVIILTWWEYKQLKKGQEDRKG